MWNAPSLTSAQAREVDRVCAERFHLPVEWLMEAAGWELARHCRGQTTVLCGTGNNGGDGLAAARHLHRWGRLHAVACVDRNRLKGPAAGEAEVLERLGLSIENEPRLAGAEIVSADLPSGLDADSGRAYDPCIRARVTVTLGFLKVGLQQGDGPAFAGHVEIADIGIPNEALP